MHELISKDQYIALDNCTVRGAVRQELALWLPEGIFVIDRQILLSPCKNLIKLTSV
jgi:hypothetical protein